MSGEFIIRRELHRGRTAGGFFMVGIDMRCEETGTMLELFSPHPADEIPRSIPLNIAQAREIARALLEGAELAEQLVPGRCITCGLPVGVEVLECLECELRAKRERKQKMKAGSRGRPSRRSR